MNREEYPKSPGERRMEVFTRELTDLRKAAENIAAMLAQLVVIAERIANEKER